MTYATFLGVTLDRTLSFAEHARRTRIRVRQRQKPISSTIGEWGAEETTVRSVYTSYVRSAPGYAEGTWMPAAAQSTMSSVDVEHGAARTKTGCFNNLYAKEVVEEARLVPLRTGGKMKAAKLYETADPRTTSNGKQQKRGSQRD